MIAISKYNKQHPLRVFEAFAGYGSQSLAFKYLKDKHPEFDFKVVGYSEIEPSAIQAYGLLHGRDIPNFGDVTRIDWNEVPDFDFISWSSPCQDFSNAGLRQGAEEGSGTRSSLTMVIWHKGNPIIGTMHDGLWYQQDLNGMLEQLMFQSEVTHVSFLPSPNEDRERKNPSHHR